MDEVLLRLRVKNISVPSWEGLSRDYIPERHPIVADSTLRPKEKIKKGKRELPAKILYPAEKIAVRKLTQMAFTIPVQRDLDEITSDETLKEYYKSVESVYNSNRINGINYKRFKAFFACCEMCTIWYAYETEKVPIIYRGRLGNM